MSTYKQLAFLLLLATATLAGLLANSLDVAANHVTCSWTRTSGSAADCGTTGSFCTTSCTAGNSCDPDSGCCWDYNPGASCFNCGDGSCHNEACSYGATNNCAADCGSSDANCNGVDNDCDGTADDNYASVNCGSGTCLGNTACSSGTVSCDTSGDDCGTCCACSTGLSPISTYDSAQSADCPSTSCTSACGAGDCAANIWGAYAAASVSGCSAKYTCNSCGTATCEADNDGDGYSAGCGDCDDSSAAKKPGASDANCDGVDNDCDGTADDNYASVACGEAGTCAGTTSCVSGSVVCKDGGGTNIYNTKDCGTCCKCTSGTSASPSSAYDSGQSAADCATATTCTDACNAGSCGAKKWGNYFDESVANACSSKGNCRNPTCGTTTTTTKDQDGDGTIEKLVCSTDYDGDGYAGGPFGSACYDCNDEPEADGASFNPAAIENNCDGIDQDCDKKVDETYTGCACGTGTCAGTSVCSTKNADATTAGGTVAGATISCGTYNQDCTGQKCCKCGGGVCPDDDVIKNPNPYYDDTQDSDCAATSCTGIPGYPSGCGLGGCGHKVGTYPASVANTCAGIDSCTSNDCTAACATDGDSDEYAGGAVGSACYDCNQNNDKIYPGSCLDPASITYPSTCANTGTGACGTGTCTNARDTTGNNCGTTTKPCNFGESRECITGDIWADTDTDTICTQKCAAGACGTCTPPDCNKAPLSPPCQRCEGQTSTTPLAMDGINDFSPCSSPQTDCPFTPYTDACADTSILNEYYCSGNDYAVQQVNCNLYDGNCDGACGSVTDGCKGRDYGCSIGACTYTPIDADTSPFWCTGCSLQWLNGGETKTTAFGEYSQGDLTSCCGDDPAENVRFRDCADGKCEDDPADTACCNKIEDCVFKGKCYNDVNSVVSLIQSDPEAQNFCGTKHTQTACTGGLSKAKYMCTWDGSTCRPAATKAGVFLSQLELGDKALYPAYADINADGQFEVCLASSPGQWERAEGRLHGYTRNVSTSNCKGTCSPADCSKGCPIGEATVKVLGTSPPLQIKADANGEFWIPNAPVGAMDIMAAGTGYDAKVLSNIFIPDDTQVEVDFTLVQNLGGCEDDCTLTGSNACDANCHGKGLCWFYSDETKTLCDGTFGVIEIASGPDAGKYINCCEGKPYAPIKAVVEVPAKDVVTIKRPINRLGEIMNIVITVFKPGTG